ncbi:transcriptional regulator [Sphingomonas sp. AP4-R1]|uniref:winged helix-turn-helix domain-containing protein n=1 Tax=Sphingomonas sp. AP4-R1 TaxID=2735134 RepID=UPI001493A6CF|nr:transcriptional regulator [Sphingomonas sp. AP4-R1]QJU60141.1 transcriptional regulator [Sphingomonas sp. AP4-R1]
MVPDLVEAAIRHAQPCERRSVADERVTGAWQPRSFAFGPFLLQPEHQLLLRADQPVRIGGRAFDILTILVRRPGQVVSKRELFDLVWPAIFVDESNLKANVAALRRALGERHAEPRYIATIIGRGYRFVSPVRAFGDGYAP